MISRLYKRTIKFFNENPLIGISLTLAVLFLLWKLRHAVRYAGETVLGMEKEKYNSPFRQKFKITTLFGEVDKLHSTPHNGIDLATPIGTPIYAPKDGELTDISNDKGGVQLALKFEDGWQIRFAHLKQVLMPENGNKVKAGEIIALAGNSGAHTTGPHTHLTVMNPLGVRVNPLDYIDFDNYQQNVA